MSADVATATFGYSGAAIARELRAADESPRGDRRALHDRPIHVNDPARLCVEHRADTGNLTPDAVGPEAVSFKEMVTIVRSATEELIALYRAVLGEVPT